MILLTGYEWHVDRQRQAVDPNSEILDNAAPEMDCFLNFDDYTPDHSHRYGTVYYR